MTVPAGRHLSRRRAPDGARGAWSRLRASAAGRRPRFRRFLAAVLLAAGVVGAPAAQPMPIMTTVGCVEPAAGGFRLVRATEPQAVQERLSPEPPADASLGSRTIRLIGTLDEFGVGRRAGHKVWAKGLLNPDAAGGTDRLNLTSITTLSDRCEP